MNASLHLWLIPLLPFLGFLVNGLLGRRFPKPVVSAVALLFPLASFGVVARAALLAWQGSLTFPYIREFLGNGENGSWIAAGPLKIDFTFALDQLSLTMLLIITGVGFLIHLYSVGYMGEEEGYWRYFSYLNLFLFFMTVLVLAENYLLMFVGWEGVGLASYLLIGFYYNRDSAARAGRKAFVVNRVGDFGFLIGMFLLIAHFGSLSVTHINAALALDPGSQGGIYTAIALCLVIGACGKSAQIPLYVWLPDAMEGPTPVSALIHAATMVTAGVYMISRTHLLFDRSPLALSVVAIIGAATAFFAATVGLVQTDIKRVLAYSTISQLGYMFLGCGVGAYSAAVFHLMTHAFFKALLFLAAGSVIHGLAGEQDLLKMGGLKKYLPVTFWTMTAGVIAIAGIPPFAGFFSKDAILYEAFQHGSLGKLLYAVGLVTAALTSFYMFRLWYLAFLGSSRATDAHGHTHPDPAHVEPTQHAEPHHPHESPWVMLFPLVILAFLSVVGGLIGIERFGHFLAPIVGPVADPAELPGGKTLDLTLSVVAVAAGVLGWLVAHLLYSKGTQKAERLAASMPALHKILVNKYGIDELYNAVIVTPITLAARYLLGWIGEGMLVRGSAWLLAGLTGLTGELARRWQSGNLRSYSAWLAAGAAAFLIFAYYMHAHVLPGFEPGQAIHMILPAGK